MLTEMRGLFASAMSNVTTSLDDLVRPEPGDSLKILTRMNRQFFLGLVLWEAGRNCQFITTWDPRFSEKPRSQDLDDSGLNGLLDVRDSGSVPKDWNKLLSEVSTVFGIQP